ncbi:DUF3114 domain-containing protein [Leuconostocaceae bacterium ESL0723]|nr:DUF3114 domain-containing protein [Leuconostocaceae bacterium ESL0723]
MAVSRLKLSSIQRQELLNQGWPKHVVAALGLYFKRWARQQAEGVTGDDFIQALAKIGSGPYTWAYRFSFWSAKKRICLVLNQLGAELDEDGFLQLKGPAAFDPDLPPHGTFLKLFRRDVQRAFARRTAHDLAWVAEQNTADGRLAQQVHLLRYWIDRHNLAYVQQHFDGDNDFSKLRSYLTAFNLEADYRTDATYHNRTFGAFDYPHQFKVQVPKDEKMSEFIVSLADGNFVSQWQVLKQTEGGQIDSNPDQYQPEKLGPVANTESFNYGRPHHRSHRLLDIHHPVDADVRRLAVHYWPFEHDFDDWGHLGDYADIVKGGGVSDWQDWQSVPPDQRLAVYQGFVQDCRQRGYNPGFAAYW